MFGIGIKYREYPSPIDKSYAIVTYGLPIFLYPIILTLFLSFMNIMDPLLFSLSPRAANFANCTLSTCPVSDSVYGYLPTKAGTLIFIALFAISFIVHMVQGIKSKSWTFLVALGVGTLSEAVGL